MELLKPKREETVKQEYEVLKEDHEFVKWISKQRTNKKFFQHGLLHHLSEEQKQLFEPYPEEETLDESDEEICI